MSDEIVIMVATRDRLCPAHLATAIGTARETGRAFAEHFLPCIVAAASRGQTLLPNSRSYYVLIIHPLWEDGSLADQDLARWKNDFESGAAFHDPRVQAFAAAYTERSCQLAAEIGRNVALLARFLEVQPGELSLAAGESCQVIFGYRGERFLVLSQREADELVACPCTGRMRKDRFIGCVIVRWT